MINLGKIKTFKIGKLVFVIGYGFSQSYLGIRFSFQPEYYDDYIKQYDAKALISEASFLQKRYFIGILFCGKEKVFIKCICECNRENN